MSGTFLHPLTCGFARGIAWQIAVQVDANENIKCEDNESRKDFQARLMRERYDRFSDIFQDCKENFPADFKRFQAIFPPLRNKFSRWNHRKVTERNQYTAAFNIKAWNELSPAMQIEHTFKDCKPCQLKFNKIQALFPVKSNRFSNILKENNLSAANKAIEVRLPNQTRINSSTTLREASEAAKSLYDQVNPTFETITGHSLVKALTKVKDLNIEKKKSLAEKKRTRRNNYRKFKEVVEKEWENTPLIRYNLRLWSMDLGSGTKGWVLQYIILLIILYKVYGWKLNCIKFFKSMGLYYID